MKISDKSTTQKTREKLEISGEIEDICNTGIKVSILDLRRISFILNYYSFWKYENNYNDLTNVISRNILGAHILCALLLQ